MINLRKGETVSLSKDSSSLTKVTMGLGWAEIGKSGGFFKKLLSNDSDIDLDASVGIYDGNKGLVDVVWYPREFQTSKDGNVKHSGDNITGGTGKNDDEQIVVNLMRISPTIKSLIFVITSYRGHTLDTIKNSYCRMLDQNGKEIVRYNITEQPSVTGMIVASVFREGNGWSMKAIGEPCTGKTVQDITHLMVNHA